MMGEHKSGEWVHLSYDQGESEAEYPEKRSVPSVHSSPTATTTFPLEVHLFEYHGCYYAFDVRNFSILKLDADSAAVLSRMRNLSLDAIIEELTLEIPAPVVRAH